MRIHDYMEEPCFSGLRTRYLDSIENVGHPRDEIGG